MWLKCNAVNDNYQNLLFYYDYGWNTEVHSGNFECGSNCIIALHFEFLSLHNFSFFTMA